MKNTINYVITKKDMGLMSYCFNMNLTIYPVHYKGMGMFLMMTFQGVDKFLDIPTSDKTLGYDLMVQYRKFPQIFSPFVSK